MVEATQPTDRWGRVYWATGYGPDDTGHRPKWKDDGADKWRGTIWERREGDPVAKPVWEGMLVNSPVKAFADMKKAAKVRGVDSSCLRPWSGVWP